MTEPEVTIPVVGQYQITKAVEHLNKTIAEKTKEKFISTGEIINEGIIIRYGDPKKIK